MLPTTADGESEIYGTYSVTSPIYSSTWSVLWGPQTRSPDINPVFIHRIDNDKEKELGKRILDIVYYARDKKDCTEAFKAVGATPINDQILNTTIVTENAFTNEAFDENWTRGSDIGRQMRKYLTSTTNDLTWPGIFQNTGWRFIGLTNRAIDGKDDYLSVVIIHSLVHSGGVTGKDSQTWVEWTFGINPHDLRYLGEKYKEILKHCTREGHSKAFGQ